MTRQIKFRAWDKEKKEWLLGYDYPNLGGFSIFGETMMMGEYSELLSSYFPNNIENIALMQFTGLFDKNGKEIYEGDVISCQRVGNSLRDRKIVFFTDGMFTANEIGDEERSSTPVIGIKSEIIGNIWENPELLK